MPCRRSAKKSFQNGCQTARTTNLQQDIMWKCTIIPRITQMEYKMKSIIARFGFQLKRSKKQNEHALPQTHKLFSHHYHIPSFYLLKPRCYTGSSIYNYPHVPFVNILCGYYLLPQLWMIFMLELQGTKKFGVLN